MIGIVEISEPDLYRALVDLAQSIAGHHDLRTLCDNLATALRRVVTFDFLGLVLYDASTNELRFHLAAPSKELPREAREESLRDELHWPADDPTDAACRVWIEQRSLRLTAADRFGAAPELAPTLEEHGIQRAVVVPLTTGEHRIGVLGFGSSQLVEQSDEELAFLERVASEFAVTVESYLTRQELKQERDRLQVLFDITNTLVSKLEWDDLLAAISEQLDRVVRHDIAVLSVTDKVTGEQVLLGLRYSGELNFDTSIKSARVEGLPTAEALRTGRPVAMNKIDFERYPSPLYRMGVESGIRTGCSIPLVTGNGACGVLDLGRRDGAPFQEDEVRLLVQVGRQIAIAIENSMAFHELATMRDKLATEKLYLEDEIRFDQNLTNMIGDSPAFQAMLRSAQVVAPTDATVLILGETGTGKELVARAIHDMSGRSKHTFVKVNCAAIPATLLESELFGHEKGAFTGAVAQKIGRFELADHGTLFLDEVGEIPLELQPKLLRAIQEQEFERLGSNRTIHTDIRLVAATNRNLKAMVEEGKFRSDLYYRLHVFPLEVPPLRDRRPDIPLLIRFFAQKYAQRMNRHIESIPSAAIEALNEYAWPGNIRELQNLVERSVILSEGKVLRLVLPESRTAHGGMPLRGADRPAAEERERILQALKDARGIVGGPHGAAARLGLHRTTLQSRMVKLKIGREYR